MLIEADTKKNTVDNIFQFNVDEKCENTDIKSENPDDKELEEIEKEETDKYEHKFGWFIGVFARCLLNIFGVIMFIRVFYIYMFAHFIIYTSGAHNIYIIDLKKNRLDGLLAKQGLFNIL